MEVDPRTCQLCKHYSKHKCKISGSTINPLYNAETCRYFKDYFEATN